MSWASGHPTEALRLALRHVQIEHSLYPPLPPAVCSPSVSLARKAAQPPSHPGDPLPPSSTTSLSIQQPGPFCFSSFITLTHPPLLVSYLAHPAKRLPLAFMATANSLNAASSLQAPLPPFLHKCPLLQLFWPDGRSPSAPSSLLLTPTLSFRTLFSWLPLLMEALLNVPKPSNHCYLCPCALRSSWPLIMMRSSCHGPMPTHEYVPPLCPS